jgi:hypothetical protein
MKQLISMIIFYLFSLNANLIKLSDFIRHTKYESVNISLVGSTLLLKQHLMPIKY